MLSITEKFYMALENRTVLHESIRNDKFVKAW